MQLKIKPAWAVTVAAALLLCAGCASIDSTVRRAGVVSLGTGAAGLAGYVASDRDPTTTLVSAAAGGLVTQLAMGEDTDVRQAGFDQGYVQGQSDAIKRQYFLRQAAEKQPAAPATAEGQTVYYLMPGPEVTVDGRKLAPHRVAVRVVE